MNLKERIEESKKTMAQFKVAPNVCGEDLYKALLDNQIAIMESLTELKQNMKELATS